MNDKNCQYIVYFSFDKNDTLLVEVEIKKQNKNLLHFIIKSDNLNYSEKDFIDYIESFREYFGKLCNVNNEFRIKIGF